MNRIVTIILLAASMALSGCGSNSTAVGNVNGTWNATLNSSGSETFAFVTNLTVNSDGALGPENFKPAGVRLAQGS
jgi:hypothetical protein